MRLEDSEKELFRIRGLITSKREPIECFTSLLSKISISGNKILSVTDCEISKVGNPKRNNMLVNFIFIPTVVLSRNEIRLMLTLVGLLT